jgi:hypothetical protein
MVKYKEGRICAPDRRNSGFLLMDALAALALITSGVFVCVVFFRTEVRELRNTQEKFAALLIAESEIERFHTLRYDQIAVGEDQPLALNLPSARALKEAAGTVTVKELERGIKRAEVRIGWSSPTGAPLHVALAEEFTSCAERRALLVEASGQ